MSDDDTTDLEKAPAVEGVAAFGASVLKKALPLAMALLLVSATIWSLSIFGMTIYHDYLRVPVEVEVPKVDGLEIKEAYEVLEKSGLNVKVHEYRHDKKVKKRIVLSQDPVGGKQVREGRTILIVVSLGPELMPVPKLTGESLRTAKIKLSNNKLRLGEVTFEDASYGQDEEVTKQNPSAGKEVPRGQEVHLTVRRGSY